MERREHEENHRATGRISTEPSPPQRISTEPSTSEDLYRTFHLRGSLQNPPPQRISSEPSRRATEEDPSPGWTEHRREPSPPRRLKTLRPRGH